MESVKGTERISQKQENIMTNADYEITGERVSKYLFTWEEASSINVEGYRLPTKDELSLLMQRDSFEMRQYWSASEHSSGTAWYCLSNYDNRGLKGRFGGYRSVDPKTCRKAVRLVKV
jgi:hypothetical protein